MQNIKQKWQELNRRPFKRWELYLQFAYPWVVAGVLAIASALLLAEMFASKLTPLWLFAIVVAMVVYMVFAMGYIGVRFIKPYMDGIYQQYLKEHEEQIAKETNESTK